MIEKLPEESLKEKIQELMDVLGEPEKGEFNYNAEKRKDMTRIEALRELKRLEDEGVIEPPRRCGWVNVHVHTSESFSIFKSPSEAVWEAYRSGLEIFGINDHYTVAGHGEFGEACKILGLKAVFSIEAIAMSEEAKRRGERYNDPKNPGRVYLCGKGVVRDLEPGSFGDRLLKRIRCALRKRYEEMTEKANLTLKSVDSSLNLTFDRVLRQTPRGNVTERHVSQAIAELIKERFQDESQLKEFIRKLFGDSKAYSLNEDLQETIRNELLKAGGPAYVEEPTEAFPSIKELVSLFREYGAIPTYPILGNPVTEKESNLNLLFDELEGYGIFAVEVIPKRNTRERLVEILNTAERRGFPIFSGTEHNTRIRQPLVDEFSKDPFFLTTFKKGAYLLLGHQFLSKYSGKGYVDEEGNLTFKDRFFGVSFFSFIGRVTWPDDVLEWFKKVAKFDVFKIAIGLYSTLKDEQCKWKVKRGFKVPNHILEGVTLKLENTPVITFKNETRCEFENLVKTFVVKEGEAF